MSAPGFTGKIRAYSRILLCGIVLVYYLCGLSLFNLLYGRSAKRGFRYRKKFTGVAMRILGIRVQFSGSPQEGSVLYVSNHRCMIDPVIQLHFLEAYIVSKAEVGNYPLLGSGSRQSGVIFVHRGEQASRSATRDSIRKALQSGHSVLIYPEGTVSTKYGTLEFRKGSFEVAASLGIPVVPVMMEYGSPEDYWSSESLLSHFVAKFSKRRILAFLHIGEPLLGADGLSLASEAESRINGAIRQFKDSLH